ncbi:hypothetical protein HDR58_11295, partial [bacterium]|nr:hypothetical protein [bacterium]
MSITLMAYPMAFLISPEEAKNEKLRKASDNVVLNEQVANNNLRSIRVLTNLEYPTVKSMMPLIQCTETASGVYTLYSGLNVNWQMHGKYCIAELYGAASPEVLQSESEAFFRDLDTIAGHNVRLIDSSEFFYYNYSTSYTSMKEIYEKLKSEGANHIYSTGDDEVIAELNGQNIKYYKSGSEPIYMLEVEQKVTILNIGMTGDVQGTNVTYGHLTNLKIKTN